FTKYQTVLNHLARFLPEVYRDESLHLDRLSVQVIRTIPPLANRLPCSLGQQRIPADHVQAHDSSVARDDGVQFHLALNADQNRRPGVNRFYPVDDLRHRNERPADVRQSWFDNWSLIFASGNDLAEHIALFRTWIVQARILALRRPRLGGTNVD